MDSWQALAYPDVATASNPYSHEDRCIGCLLGTASGDILGAGVEGQSADTIRGRHGEVRDFFGHFSGIWLLHR